MVGQYVPTRGLTCVLQSLITHMKSECDISLVGLCYAGPAFDNGAKIYPDLLEGHQTDCSNPELAAFLMTAKPHVIFLMHDISVQAGYLAQLRSSAPDCKIVTYTTVDGFVLQDDLLSQLGSADRCVFFCDFARVQAERFIPFSHISVIPSGVDTELFYPCSGSVDAQFQGNRRRNARQTMFPNDPDLLDAFIVLNANQPWPRKRIDLTIEGFALFAQDKPTNVRLVLHHAGRNEWEMDRILRIAKRFNIVNRIMLTPIVDGKSELSVKELNLLYNACDIGVNTAMGEGWGLVNFEHAATGAAQIVPRHSACVEIWDGAADFLEPMDKKKFLFAPHYQLQPVAAEDLAKKLERLYRDEDYQRDMAIAAYQRVTLPKYDWRNIAKEWVALFESVLES
jgi:glycosyltransferase involved in cell wall biosynthesis